MIGQTIHARSPFSYWIAFLMAIGVAFVAWSVASGNPHLGITAILPLVLAFCVWRGRPQQLTLMVEHDGLQHFGSAEKIRYSDITEVAVGGRLYAGDALSIPLVPIEIHHIGGRLTVPPQMNVAHADFYRFLVSKTPPRPTRPVPDVLAEYVNEHTTKFGAPKIHIIHSRRLLAEQWRKRRKLWVCGGFLATALIWAAVGFVALSIAPKQDEYVGWIVAAAILGFVTVLAFFAKPSSFNATDLQAMKFPNSCIVIGPAGLAMVQGPIRGAMPWHEITNVSTNMSQFLRTSRVRGLQIKVRGGEILAFDIYEHTPAEIEMLIRRNLGLQT